VIIVTRTRMGRDCPQEFEVRDFVEPALQLLQEGFRVSRAEMESEVRGAERCEYESNDSQTH
jgi:hypothetical protein